MRRPYGSESHATGSEIRSRLSDAMNTTWGTRAAERMSPSAALDLAQQVCFGSQWWTEEDVARAFGVRPSMVSRRDRRGEAVAWRAELSLRANEAEFAAGRMAGTTKLDDRIAVILGARLAGWDPNLYPLAAAIRVYDRATMVPAVRVIDRRAVGL